MFNILLRALILFGAVFFVTRSLGKRQIGELQPYEFVFAMMAADLASVPMSDLNLPLLWGILAILLLGLVQMIISYLSLKSMRMRKLFCGVPCVLISNGVVQERMLRDLRYTLSDLTEQLRTKDVFSITDVNYAILETNGEISVLLKGAAMPVKPDMLGIVPKETTPSYVLVSDGKILSNHLEEAGKDVAWIQNILQQEELEEKNILVCQYTPQTGIFLQTKGESPITRIIRVE